MASADLRDKLICSICLNVFTDPVILRCGHNFCRVCIGRVLDSQEGSGEYNCPECREGSQERHELRMNVARQKISERFLSSQLKQEETGVFCMYCSHSPEPAVKSCLMCEASLCDDHLRVHSKSLEHVLSDPTTALGKQKCSIHKYILQYYCPDSAACLCVSCCLAGEHSRHQVDLLDEASEKKEKLRDVLKKLTSKREETANRVQGLQERRRDKQEKAAGVTERVTALFRDVRRQLVVLERRALSEISRQEEQVSLQVSDLIQQLEIKKNKLSREICHIEELCNMTDPLTVLQDQVSDRGDLCDPGEIDRDDSDNFDEGLISVTLHSGLLKIVTDVKNGFYVQEASDLLLNVDTAANNIDVSGDLKMASRSKNQSRPVTPGRFRNYNQVLSIRTFSSGRHYWEVETNESGNRRIGVAYASMDRKGNQSWIGCNNKSWCLSRYNTQYSVRHDHKEDQLPNKSSCSRLGIYLDYEAGRLSFYENDPIRHLHTFTATFTEPLHAAFCVGRKAWVRIRS